MVLDLNPGTAGSDPSDLMVHDGRLVFVANVAGVGYELFTTEGAFTPIHLVADLWPGPGSGNPEHLTTFGGELYFKGSDSIHGNELFKTDLTPAGTSVVADVNPPGWSSYPANLTASGSQLFFTADDGTSGEELWVTDGTSGGTMLVKDLAPGGTSGPNQLLAAAGGVYFEADGTNGEELHFSDGTAAGTALVCDVYFAAVGSYPQDLILCDGSLYFHADHPQLGKELFHVPLAGAYAEDLGPEGTAARIDATDPILGGSVTFSGTGTPAGHVGVLVMSAHTGTPNGVLMAPGHTSWIDLATASVQGVFTTPSWSITKPVPAAPSLVGGQLNLQGWLLPPGTFPAEATNGLHLVLGD